MMMRTPSTRLAAFGGLVLAGLALAVAGRMLAGGSLFDTPAWRDILELRLWRVITGGVVGAALGGAGVVLQALLRNPLAGPEVLGVSSGATLAVVVAAWIGVGIGAGGGGGGAFAGGAVPMLAWQGGPAVIGAIGALAVVYLLSQRRGIVNPVDLILTGVVLSVLCGAGVMFVQHASGGLFLGSARVLVGELSDDASGGAVFAVGGVVAATLIIAAWLGPSMDAASLGDDEAASVGVNVQALRLALLALAGVLAAGAVTLAGPIGFVGLIAPHLVRLGAGMAGGHRAQVALGALVGATIVIAGDAVIKLLQLGGGRMPLGVVTAVLGGPVFLVMLRRGAGGAGGRE